MSSPCGNQPTRGSPCGTCCQSSQERSEYRQPFTLQGFLSAEALGTFPTEEASPSRSLHSFTTLIYHFVPTVVHYTHLIYLPRCSFVHAYWLSHPIYLIFISVPDQNSQSLQGRASGTKMAPQVSPMSLSQTTSIPTTRPLSSPGSKPCENDPYQSSDPHFTMSSTSIATSNITLSTTTAVKCGVMLQYLRQRQTEKLWSDGDLREGVILRRAKDDFVCQPPELSQQRYGFYDEMRKLNVKVKLHQLLQSQATHEE